ncbi:MAG: BTAD domain-containing putative transcriptional regulator [Lacrimispora sp.]|uniref:BTAD domain-containing putative transcriptional regulator n=1 Tax=Lacrimispora sp. TaxID=2719234 RepID=UPI0039E5B35C
MEKHSIQLLKQKKLHPKECRYSLERTELLKKLLHTEASIMMLHGKAGYGKTELIRQYCQRCSAASFWYTLDSSDNDVWKFLSYLDCLFFGIFQEYQPSSEPEGVQTRFLHILLKACEQLEQDENRRYVMVFDSLEAIRNDKIMDIFKKMASSLPENLKLVFITRGSVPDFMFRHVMKGTCLLLDETDLAFAEEEQRTLAGKMLSCNGEEAKRILGQCAGMLGGWPAGLVLALLCIEKRQLNGEAVNWSYLFQDSMINSFMSSEIFQELSGEEKDFLISTSGMLELKQEICDRVLQKNNSGAMIRSLLKKNLLLSCGKNGVGRICHHEAIRLFLKERADSALQAELARKTAEYYLEEKDCFQAVRQAVDIGYTALIIKVMEVYGSELLGRDGDQILGRCVRYLEEDVNIMGEKPLPEQNITPPDPEVLGIAAQYYYKSGIPEKMERYLNRADSSFGKENKYGMYRGLYKGLLKYQEDPSKYEKQISNTMFLLEENRYGLPYLKQEELAILDRLEDEKKQEKPGALRVTFFGDFQAVVVKEQKPLSWRTRKGSELFACLVELNGRAVGRKQLFQKLWSEDLPDNAVTMLHNMFYNIRKELSAYHMEDLIQYKERLYCIRMETIETDLAEIRSLCALIDQKKTEELKLHKERFSTYWGRYLEDMDNQRIAEQREYYDTRFFMGCAVLAEESAAAGQYPEAIRFLKNAMMINSYSEELAGSLLKCYGAMQNLKLAKSEYERFTSLLERDLGLKPGWELAEIYRKVMNA